MFMKNWLLIRPFTTWLLQVKQITRVQGKVREFQKPLVVVTMYKRSINSTWKQLTVQQQVKAETKLQFIETHI